MTSSGRLVRFGVGRIGCVREHLMRAPTSEQTREPFKGCNAILPLSGDVGVSELIGQMGTTARDRRPIIV
jgi:hypothetical protein